MNTSHVKFQAGSHVTPSALNQEPRKALSQEPLEAFSDGGLAIGHRRHSVGGNHQIEVLLQDSLHPADRLLRRTCHAGFQGLAVPCSKPYSAVTEAVLVPCTRDASTGCRQWKLRVVARATYVLQQGAWTAASRLP